MTTKRCAACGRQLPLSEFGEDSTASDGLRSSCKSCRSARRKQRRRIRQDKEYETAISSGLKKVTALDTGFCHWLAGLTDGEGCFAAYAAKTGQSHRLFTAFVISMRNDDVDMLRMASDTLGVGYLYPVRRTHRRGNRAPCARLEVARTEELRCIIMPLFQTYRLRSKKQRDFEIWSQIVDLKWKQRRERWTEQQWQTAIQLTDKLQAVREYQKPGARQRDTFPHCGS